MDTPKAPNKAIIALVVVVLLVVVATTIAIASGDSASQQTITTSSPASSSNASTSSASTTGTDFKDGKYSALGAYDSPGGRQSIGLSVTLADNVISDVSITQNATDREALEYQSQFASGFKSEVVGKKVNEVSLNRVAGSSLTPIGFNSALDIIKSQAAA